VEKVFCILYFNCIWTNQGAFVQNREGREKVYITGFDRFPNAMCLSKCKYTEAKSALFHEIECAVLVTPNNGWTKKLFLFCFLCLV